MNLEQIGRNQIEPGQDESTHHRQSRPDRSRGDGRNTEADTCRKYVVPKLIASGWDSEPHSIAEQRSITDGRVIPVGKESFVRKSPKRVD
jgi:hypothetical protein